MRTLFFGLAIAHLFCAHPLEAKRSYAPITEGSGKYHSERRPLTNFTQIHLSGTAEVFLTIGDKSEVVIEGDDNVLPLVKTSVSNEVLTISTKKSRIDPKLPLVYKITTPHLHALSISGCCNVKGLSDIHADSFSINLAGIANIDLSLSVTNLEIQISGAGSTTLEGYARNQVIGIAGSGKFYGYGLKGDDIRVKIAGSGLAQVYPVQTLDANVTGSGKIRYIANPKVKQRITGSGTVEHDLQRET